MGWGFGLSPFFRERWLLMFKITFAFEDGSVVETYANAGDNLLEIARDSNVAIDAPCSGNASCGKCRVKLTEGTLDSLQSRHIS